MPRHPDPKDRITKVTGADGSEFTVTDTGFVAMAAKVGDRFRVGSTWLSLARGRSASELTAGDLMMSGLHDDMEAAVAHADVLANHWADVGALDRRSDRALATTSGGKPVRTPWGPAQTATAYGEGVTSFDTSGHGGFKLSAKANAQVPAPLRIQGGWYEEDGEWARVAHAFPDLFTSYERGKAARTLRNWSTDEYEAATGQTVPLEESLVKRRRAFEAEHAGSMRVVSATTDRENHPGMVVVTARQGGREGTGDHRRFLVPGDEYAAGENDFVVDEVRHEEMTDAPAPRM